jgi:hypothetical protein
MPLPYLKEFAPKIEHTQTRLDVAGRHGKIGEEQVTSRLEAKLSCIRRRSQVVKAGVCKTPIAGSNPAVAFFVFFLT